MKTIISYFCIVLFAVVAFDFAREYYKATSTSWQRVWDAGRGSATIVWQQFGLAVAALVGFSEQLTDGICQLVNAPGADEAIKGAIQAYLTPTSVAAAMVGFAAVTIWARSRTL